MQLHEEQELAHDDRPVNREVSSTATEEQERTVGSCALFPTRAHTTTAPVPPSGHLIRGRGVGFGAMASAPTDQVELETGERIVRAWPVDATRPDGADERPGWLILTDRRLFFFRRVGRWGPGRLERPPEFARRLEEIRSTEPRRFWMKIGYGDRVEIPGLAIDELSLRLNRETRSREVFGEILGARQARRTALGLSSP